MIRKRLLSACLALVLCLSLLPVTALAADGDTVYVGGVALTGSTGSPAYATTDKDTGVVTHITSTDGEPVNWNIKWDGSTLTLCSATIKKELYASNLPLSYIAGAAIGVLNQNGVAKLTITLEGTNRIEDVSAAIHVFASSGSANLTITGDGILSASSVSNPGIRVQSNTGNGTLAITGAKVTASSSSSGNGVQIRVGDGSNASLTVNGGSLTATGSGATFAGIQLLFGSGGSGSGTPTVTVSGNAVVDAKNGGIANNSSSPIQYKTGSESTGGIVFDGNTGTVYGKVELQEDLEIGEGESLTIPDGASLTIGNDATLTNEGTVTTTDGGTLTNNGTIDNSGTLPSNIGGTAPPSITTTSPLAGGTVGTAYSSVTLSATGSPTSWAWSAAAGSNTPPGLTLNSNGTITGTPTAANTYTFTVKATNTYGSDSKEFTLSIDEQGTIPATGVTLNKSETTLTVGGTETLTATITPDTATNKTVTWTSSNPNVATVDNGVVRAVGNGSAVITVTTEDGNYTAVCTVYVAPYIPPVPSYLIQLPEVEGGTVTADRAAARQGTEVTLTVTPDEGFALASLTVTDFFGNQVDISRNSDGTYSFVMPASQVTVSAAFAPAQLPFTDVTEANWYYDEVYYVWANGLMQGTSAATFGPNVDTTRAMVVTILWRLEGEPASGYDMDYSDVAGGAWYADAVRWATEHGIVNGSEGQFYPGGTVTREQLAAMLYRYAQYKGYDLTAGGDLSGFADAGAVSGWAETSLAWAVGQGLLQGSDSQVDPQGSAIRAQTAAILMRFCENMLE